MGGGGGIFLNPNFTGGCHFLIAYGGQLDMEGGNFVINHIRGGGGLMIHMHIKILFQQSLLLLLLNFFFSAFHILGYLDIFIFRYFFVWLLSFSFSPSGLFLILVTTYRNPELISVMAFKNFELILE